MSLENQPLWKAVTLAKWDEIGAKAVLDRVGMNYEQDFVQALLDYPDTDDPYADHEWSVFQFPRLASGVLHAAPKTITDAPVVWEEWYFEDGAAHHNILRNYDHPEQTKEVTLDDDEHPSVVMNIRWRYRDDSDHRPLFFR